jgi:hypothetical protein
MMFFLVVIMIAEFIITTGGIVEMILGLIVAYCPCQGSLKYQFCQVFRLG